MPHDFGDFAPKIKLPDPIAVMLDLRLIGRPRRSWWLGRTGQKRTYAAAEQNKEF